MDLELDDVTSLDTVDPADVTPHGGFDLMGWTYAEVSDVMSNISELLVSVRVPIPLGRYVVAGCQSCGGIVCFI